MPSKPQVIEALRRFVPELEAHSYPLFKPACKRAIWAFENCRTPTLGWKRHHCEHCERSHFAFHSCNHKSCPQCGKLDTTQWVQRQMQKKICCHYYMLTFTLPAQLRPFFQDSNAEKLMYQLFFKAASTALASVLQNPKWLGAQHNGFMMVLHTWNQLLQFHPHIHTIVPGAGLDKHGKYVHCQEDFLVPVAVLRKRFRGNFQRLFLNLINDHPEYDLSIPHGSVWSLPWGIDIRPVGDGARAIKYLARYVNRTAIADSRMIDIDHNNKTVTFKWTDRAHGNIEKAKTLPGHEFARRFLLHVLPNTLRSIRYYGFCHPAGKKRYEKVAFHSGCKLYAHTDPKQSTALTCRAQRYSCPSCNKPMQLTEVVFASSPRARTHFFLPQKQGPDP